MKYLKYILLCLIVCLVSCSKDEADNNVVEDTDYYYVHYVFPIYGGNIKYRDADNQLKDGPTAGSPFGTNKGGLDINVGPVKKGFEAYLSGTNGYNVYYTPTMKIEVSKNNQPFVVKGTFTFRDYISNTLQYKIDY